MRQILFEIPVPFFGSLPVYGYGMMLFLAFVFCNMLARRLAQRINYPGEIFQDLAIWIFVIGIIGARITYYIQYHDHFTSFWQIFAIWDGGLVFYGSALGGALGYALFHFFFLRKLHLSPWKMADIIAPCIALGLALGRLGCLLNGCCYGNVAVCDDGSCPAISFPLSATPRMDMTSRGHQSAAGFTQVPSDQRIIAYVEPDSPAKQAGLRAGDLILAINEQPVKSDADVRYLMVEKWQRSVNTLDLTVRHTDGSEQTISYSAWTIGLHPTQIYETISMILMIFFLLNYVPFNRFDGSAMVLFMFGYAIHRYLNEMLRTDTSPVAFGLTLSQNISIVVFAAAVVLGFVVLLRGSTPPRPQPA